jgi:hypothetical protein
MEKKKKASGTTLWSSTPHRGAHLTCLIFSLWHGFRARFLSLFLNPPGLLDSEKPLPNFIVNTSCHCQASITGTFPPRAAWLKPMTSSLYMQRPLLSRYFACQVQNSEPWAGIIRQVLSMKYKFINVFHSPRLVTQKSCHSLHLISHCNRQGRWRESKITYTFSSEYETIDTEDSKEMAFSPQ